MPRHKPTPRTVTIEEPTAEDLLKDPLVHQVMAADGVDQENLKQTLDDQKRDLASKLDQR